MRGIAVLLGVAGLLAMAAFLQGRAATKAQDEQELRRIESETARLEQQNDASSMGSLAEDWVYLGVKKVISKSEFQENVKRNFVTHGNGPNPYTIEKKNMRVDLFGDTAVVTYIKEYRQTADTTKGFNEDDIDIFTRDARGWRLRLTKGSPVQMETAAN
jgi:hypothetical protein